MATLDRLGRHLPIPASPMQDAPARQHSLEATLQWSVDLLDPAEQALFRRASVFAGGWTFDAAEAIAADLDVPDVLTTLLSLADRNLLIAQEELRFRMLETAREFALGLLESTEEADAVRRRHAEFFTTLAEQAEPQMQGASRPAVVARLEREDDKFRQVLHWPFASPETETQELGLRLAGALGWYWFLHGATRISFPLLADDEPPGAVARAYQVYVPETGRSRRALFVIDPEGLVRWSATFPDMLNPGIDGVLAALEALRSAAPAKSDPVTNHHLLEDLQT